MQLLNSDGFVDFAALTTALQAASERLWKFEEAFKAVGALVDEADDSDLTVAYEAARDDLQAAHKFAGLIVQKLGITFTQPGETATGRVIALSTNTTNKNDPTDPSGGDTGTPPAPGGN